MIYPLVNDVVAEGCSIKRACELLSLHMPAYYRWKAKPVTDQELNEAYRMNLVRDLSLAHPDYGVRRIHQLAESIDPKVGSLFTIHKTQKALGFR